MSKSKATGTRWESAVVAFLRDAGLPHVERRALHGKLDRGDIIGLPGWVLSCKDVARVSFGEWIGEAADQARNAGARWHALVVKRRRSPGCTGAVSEAFVVMPLSVFADLMAMEVGA